MTSACMFKDTLRNDTQVFLEFRDSIFEICLHLINSNCTSYFLPSLMLSSGARTSKEIPLHESGLSIPALLITLSLSFFEFSYSIKKFIQSRLLKSICHPTLQSIRRILMCSSWNKCSTTSATAEQLSEHPELHRNIAHPHIKDALSFFDFIPRTSDLNHQKRLQRANNAIRIWTAAGNHFTEPHDLNLPPNPFIILVTMAVVNHTEDGNDNNYSPQSPEPSEPSPISTPLMNVSTFDSRETSHTTTDDNTFYSDDEPKRIYFLPSTPNPPPPLRKLKKN